MSETDHEGGDDEDPAMSLVRLAGARPVPPAERTHAARAYVHAAWRAGLRRRRARRALLLAAAGLFAGALAFLGRRGVAPEKPVAEGLPPARGAEVARLDAAAGPVELETAVGWVRLKPAEPLAARSHLRTGAQPAGFHVEGRRSVRVAAGSRLRWDAHDRLVLEAGAVYVDSGAGAGADAASSFEIRTEWGAVRETGTQFEVRLEPAALRVRVREGRVAVLGRRPTLDVARGTEGRRLHELLSWAAREAGWELRYADAESRRRSESARLHGSIVGLRLDEAVSAAIAATGLPHRLHEGVLSVGPVEAGPP
jgi:ferric-dicitrate binding protein FerR (iron transport regulator)